MARNAEKEMPFLDHLEELRQRLFWIVGSLFVGVAIGFALVFNFPQIIEFILLPAERAIDGKLVVTSFTEAFKLEMVVSLCVGMLLASPIIIAKLWGFFAPGLYPNERKTLVPVLFAGIILFLLGVMLCFLVALPLTLDFLRSRADRYFDNIINVVGYTSLAIPMAIAFGAMFELPLVILALTWLDIVTPQTLNKFRRYAVVILLIVCAIVTPGTDLFSLGVMFVPVYFLYEVSVVLSFIMHRRREKRLAAEQAESPA